jgi:hypothetical protein
MPDQVYSEAGGTKSKNEAVISYALLLCYF